MEYIDLKERSGILSEDEIKVITTIQGKLLHIDELISQSGLSADKVLSSLTLLELKALLERERATI